MGWVAAAWAVLGGVGSAAQGRWQWSRWHWKGQTQLRGAGGGSLGVALGVAIVGRGVLRQILLSIL